MFGVEQGGRNLARNDHQRLSRNVGQPQARHCCLRVVLGQGHHQRLVQGQPGRKTGQGRTRRVQHKSSVDRIGFKGLQLHIQSGLPELQAHFRVGLEK